MSDGTIMVELTPRDLDVIRAALSAQLRYCRNGLDKAKQDDAVNRWADRCVEVGKTMEKLR